MQGYLNIVAALTVAYVCLIATFTTADFVPPPPPNYANLEANPPSKIADDPVFIKACADMAGYYSDSGRNPALNKTLIMAGINFSYKNFYHNFKCFTDRLGLKFLPIALDKAIYHYLHTERNVPTFLMPRIQNQTSASELPASFGSEAFNLIGCRKIEAVGGALRLGYDVVFSDVDIAILRDPLPYLFIEGVDYVHSVNGGCSSSWNFNGSIEGNTGFYAVKSNEVTIRTWDLTYRACSQAPLYDDQTMFWLILRTNQHPAPAPLTQCPLPPPPLPPPPPPPPPPRAAAAAARAGTRIRRAGLPSTTTAADADILSNSVLNKQQQQQQQHSPPSLLSTHAQFPQPLQQVVYQNRIVTCPLDNCLFSSGNLRTGLPYTRLVHTLERRGQYAVTAHANWIPLKWRKLEALLRADLWIAHNPQEEQVNWDKRLQRIQRQHQRRYQHLQKSMIGEWWPKPQHQQQTHQQQHQHQPPENAWRCRTSHSRLLEAPGPVPVGQQQQQQQQQQAASWNWSSVIPFLYY